jgi:hypothetical protein
MKRNTKLTTIAFILAFISSGLLNAQDEPTPVVPAFETILLIDNQTTTNPYKGQLIFDIQHRFSQIKEINDLFGLFGSANTRLGVNYGVTDKIMLGLGTTRTFMLQDVRWKYSILTQNSKIPISLSYSGNAVLDARADKYFGPEEDYKFVYRVSTLNQLIVSTRIGEKVSLQVAPTFVWFNAVPEGYNNANAAISFDGRFQVLGFHSIICEYTQPLLQADNEVYPNLALGVEIGTSTHAFRIFASSSNSIIMNQGIAFNDKNPWDGDFQFGFNISIRF